MQRNREVWYIHKQQRLSLKGLNSGFSKDFKIAMINMFKELKKILKEWKKDMMKMSYQIENTGKEK